MVCVGVLGRQARRRFLGHSAIQDAPRQTVTCTAQGVHDISQVAPPVLGAHSWVRTTSRQADAPAPVSGYQGRPWSMCTSETREALLHRPAGGQNVPESAPTALSQPKQHPCVCSPALAESQHMLVIAGPAEHAAVTDRHAWLQAQMGPQCPLSWWTALGARQGSRSSTGATPQAPSTWWPAESQPGMSRGAPCPAQPSRSGPVSCMVAAPFEGVGGSASAVTCRSRAVNAG